MQDFVLLFKSRVGLTDLGHPSLLNQYILMSNTVLVTSVP